MDFCQKRSLPRLVVTFVTLAWFAVRLGVCHVETLATPYLAARRNVATNNKSLTTPETMVRITVLLLFCATLAMVGAQEDDPIVPESEPTTLVQNNLKQQACARSSSLPAMHSNSLHTSRSCSLRGCV